MRDTIYRDDAIRVASGYCHPANVAKELAKLPSAERKTGRWIKDKKSSPAKAGLSNYLCDQCGECGGTWRSDLKPHQFPKFCMWCGAKMKRGVEHERKKV